MEHSPLRRLPPELRNKIYDLVLRVPDPIECNIRCSHARKEWRASDDAALAIRDALAITQACKEIRHESSTTFFNINTFRFEACFATRWELSGGLNSGHGIDLQCCREWLEGIGTRNAAAISSFIIHVHRPPQDDDGDRLRASWWRKARKLERAALCPLLAPSKIFIRATFTIEYWSREARDVDVWQTVYTIPAFNKKLARIAIEAGRQEPMEQIERDTEECGHRDMPIERMMALHDYLWKVVTD